MPLLKSIFGKVKQGLERTRQSVTSGLRSMLLGKTLDEQLIKEMERRLVQADIGVKTALALIDGIKARYRAGEMKTGDEAMDYLKRELKALWPEEDRRLHLDAAAADAPAVILVAGVNGAGKTTSIAKLAKLLTDEGKSVLLGACDTYRAGAVRQLEIWAERLDIALVKGQQGGDPAAVAFDACEAGKARGVDVVILDTAGRLQTQQPLMRQLTKIRDVASRQIEGAPHEVLLVLDATTGQNAVQQAQSFAEAIDVTGVVLAKLDGTAKGGVVVAIRQGVGIPVKFIGVGETPDDLEPFDPETFVEAMFAA
jgi:fused signal recognition particle receptor